jgi:hypothetical protein
MKGFVGGRGMAMFGMPAERFWATMSGVAITTTRQPIAQDTPMDLDAGTMMNLLKKTP